MWSDLTFLAGRGRRLLRIFALLLITSIVSLGFAVSAFAAIPQSERDALVDLYGSTNGAGWLDHSGWLGDPGTECSWYGVTCSGDTVTELNLFDNNLTGSIPATISQLTNLYRLNLIFNVIGGTIPAELGQISTLAFLQLEFNALTGTIPPELGDPGNLSVLRLGNNALTGSIPAELGQLPLLDDLSLEWNQLTGQIPSTLGLLGDLDQLNLSGNQLSGSIPPALGQPGALQRMNLSFNLLTGGIPPELGQLSSLETLDLGGNDLGGSIPVEIADLSSLRQLLLHRTGLTGTIPAELRFLANLQKLWLWENHLSGPIPPELGQLVSLLEMNLSGNRLDGVLAPELAGLTLLQDLDLSYNGLSATDRASQEWAETFDPGWFDTQTVAPSELSARAGSTGQTVVSWSPIPYTHDGGRYEIFTSSALAGPYEIAAQTTDKGAIQAFLDGLTSGLTHFLAIRTVTDEHASNPNTITSEMSAGYRYCAPAGAVTAVSPLNGAADAGASVQLAWQGEGGVAIYDLYFGVTNPPSFHSSTTSTAVTVSDLAEGTTYYWSVVLHAACDAANTTSTELRSFTVAGTCGTPPAATLVSPADQATGLPTSFSLDWSDVPGAVYDLFLGSGSSPSLVAEGIAESAYTLAGLEPGVDYSWKVRARAACDPALRSESAASSFSTAPVCLAPGGTSFVFTPPGSVGVGQTYALAWKDSAGLDLAGYYLIERSQSSDFATILDRQVSPGTTATFIADEVGSYFHRVRAVAGCDPTLTSLDSAVAEVTVAKGKPAVVFAVQPEAAILPVGGTLGSVSSPFVLENISPDPVTVLIGRQEINSDAFFTVVDPAGSGGFVTLEPRVPKELEVHYSGVSTSAAASHQGVVFLASTGTQLTITPYAFVNLKIGDASGGEPRFEIGGVESSHVAFPPFTGDDSTRAPVMVEIRNNGSAPMELAAEIGPEVWLVPEDGWNDAPIPAGGTKTVELYTDRGRAPAGSPLPRYTYFTVRTRDGKTARLLVQDNDDRGLGTGRVTALGDGDRAFIVPEVVSEPSAGSSVLVSRIHLTNLGTEPVQAELYFTPEGASGFSTSVKRATVVVPHNDVVTLTDPLVQLFRLARPLRGQLEIRGLQETLGLLNVKAGVVSATGSASALAKMPVVSRSEGAVTGASHRIVGVTKSASQTTAVILSETSGREKVTVKLRLYDKSGTSLGEQSYVVEPYGHRRIADVVAALRGVAELDGGRIIVTVTSGGGAVIGVGKVSDANGENTATVLSEPMRTSSTASVKSGGLTTLAEATTTLALPMVVQGPIGSSESTQYETLVGFVAPSVAAAEFTAIFTSSVGSTLQRTVSVAAGQTVQYTNVLSQLFSVTSPVVGSMSVQAPAGSQVYSWLVSGGTQTGSVPVIDTGGVLVSSATGSSSPLHIDGMEQSTDSSRGTRWNLYIQETSGQSGWVRVSLYEAANRTYPIVEDDFPVTAGSRVPLESVFAATGLDSALRRKDRTNVLCVVRPRDGSAAITATAVEIDNATGAVQVHPLEPGTGLSSTLVTVTKVGGLGGDANGDGTVTVSDIFYLINHLFAGGPGALGSGDANGDGAVTVSDIFYLINHLFAGGPAPV